MMKSVGAALAAAALLCAPVRAACWNAEDVSAASVRELQSLLMVATLRCHAAGYDIAGDYNGFLRANKAAIIGTNDRLKAHFIRTAGPVAGQRAYDTFTTSMANGYGAASSSAEVCANMAAVEREASLMGGSIEGLVLIAEREAMAVDLPGGRCEPPVTMAAIGAERGIVAAAQPAGTPVIAARVGGTPAIARGVIEPTGGDVVAAATPVGPVAPVAYVAGH